MSRILSRIVTLNTSFTTVANFEYLGMTVTNRNHIRDEIKSRVSGRVALYHKYLSGLHPETFILFSEESMI
jgi:hypothetical protein